MQTASDRLPSDPEKLRSIVLDMESTISVQADALRQKDAQIDELTQQYQQVLEQFRLAQQRHFDPSSESTDQLGLFNKSEQSVEADWAINHIRKLYRIEADIKALGVTAKQRQRQEKATPLLGQFKAWLDKSVNQVPPKSAIGKAIAI